MRQDLNINSFRQSTKSWIVVFFHSLNAKMTHTQAYRFLPDLVRFTRAFWFVVSVLCVFNHSVLLYTWHDFLPLDVVFVFMGSPVALGESWSTN